MRPETEADSSSNVLRTHEDDEDDEEHVEEEEEDDEEHDSKSNIVCRRRGITGACADASASCAPSGACSSRTSASSIGSVAACLTALPSPLVKLDSSASNRFAPGTRLTPTEGSTRSDEGYHSNGCHDELTPPEDSSDSDSENNYVLDFSVRSGSASGRLLEKEKERIEVIIFCIFKKIYYIYNISIYF